MADDVTTPLNPPVAPIEKEKLEYASFDESPLNEAPLHINVSQRSCEKKPSIKVVRTLVDRLAWDCQSSFNPHALAIYLEFVPTRGATPERFEEC
jgi:hypothetical protein